MAKICVPVCVSRVSELANAVRSAIEVADIVELRLDCVPEFELGQSGDLRAVLKSTVRPVILTLRPAEYGGHRAISAEDRLFYRIQNSSLVENKELSDYWDLELDLALILQQREKEGNDVAGWGLVDWKQTICSHHDFVGVPHDLEQIYKAMAATPAAIIKVAVQVDDAIDCISIFRLLERAQHEGRELIAIAMGEAGVMTRILGPSRGSYLTYGSVDEDSATAPGQLTARDLRDVYRIDRINRQTQITGLIGRPVAHSLSPQIQNAAFAKANVNAVFIPFEVHDVHAFVRRMVYPGSREIDWNLRGLSVTAPHKTAVIKHLDWIEPAAKDIGAVNTIVIEEDRLRGYNTDAAAFIKSLRARFGSLANVRCAVIGAGGAARAVIYGLKNESAAVTVFARDATKAEALADVHDGEILNLSDERFEGYDVVINATPLGTRGILEAETPATANQLRGVRLAYDLVYNPLETQFMREARAAGCEAIGGLEMLIAQAVEQFRLWMGTEPDFDAMRAAAENALPAA